MMRRRKSKTIAIVSILSMCMMTLATPATTLAATDGIDLDKYELELDVEKPVELTAISMSSDAIDLKVGASAQLTFTTAPSNANDVTSITWSSADEAIATVENGLVTGRSEGTTTITATVTTMDGKNISASCQVTVEALAVTKVELDSDDFSLVAGRNKTLTAKVYPDDATYTDVTWTSSDPSVAKVENGVVTGLKAGTAQITASCENGLVADSCTVTVYATAKYPTSFSLDVHDLIMPNGHSYQFKVTYEPADATETDVTWSASWSDPVSFSDGNIVNTSYANEWRADTHVYAKMKKDASGHVTDEVYVHIPALSPAKAKAYDWYVADGQMHLLSGNIDFANASDVPWLNEISYDQITSLVIDPSIKKIGKNAFAGCKNLAKVDVPATVETIDETAFTNCQSLSDVTLHEGMAYADPARSAAIFGANTNIIIDPHVYEDGICSICGAKKPSDVTLNSASLSLEGDVILNYYLTVSDAVAADASIVLSSDSFGEKEYKLSELTKESDGSYLIRYELPAKGMHDDINLKAISGDGTPLQMSKSDGTPVAAEDGFDYSVVDYIVAANEYEGGNTKLMNLLASTRNYGSAAQIYFDHKTATSEFDAAAVSDVSKSNMANKAKVTTGEMPEGLSLDSFSLVLVSTTSLRVYFTMDESHTLNDYTITADGKAAEIIHKSGDYYYVNITGIAAQDLDESHMVSFTDGSSQMEVEYSCLSYAYSVLDNYEGTGQKEALCNLVKTLYRYNKDAESYFN